MANEHGYCGWSDLPVPSCAHCVGADLAWVVTTDG